MKKVVSAILIFSVAVTSALSYGAVKTPVPGASRTDRYKSMIEGKNVAIVANQTSMTGSIHLVDNLLSQGIKISLIFSPEHGFRELADAGKEIKSGRDPSTGIILVSLYGSQKKPSSENLKGIDVVLFDIQDVGARFYTYISTLHYVMEACAENNIKFIVLDRPNPNGFYYDGNILDTAYRSFVGMHPVPIVHGMTVGEYAQMINGEGWLTGGKKCDLAVIKCKDYTHKTYYELPIKPSPNLPNQNSVYLYPSICFFEGTVLSLGRGTDFPFQVYGSPDLPDMGFSFVPRSVPGAQNPPLLGKVCYGKDLRDALEKGLVPSPYLNLQWVIDAFNAYPYKDKFFTKYFDTLAGGTILRQQIQNGMSADEIRLTWKDGLEKFSKIRKKYLLYK
jgi:uncharacterized protein YbbC (DUF1343 family)